MNMCFDKEPNQAENVICLSLSCGQLCHFSQQRQVFFFYKLNFVQSVKHCKFNDWEISKDLFDFSFDSNYFCMFWAYKSAVKTLRRNSSCTLWWSVEVVPATPVFFFSWWPLLNDDGNLSQLHHYCAIPVSSCKGPINETVPTGNRPISKWVNTVFQIRQIFLLLDVIEKGTN